MKELMGAGVALVTPFEASGAVDYDALGRLIDHQIEGGINYLVSMGTTGESATLSPVEKQEIWKFTAKKVNGRVPLVAGIGGNNTLAVAAQMKAFNIPGYHALLSVSPYYNKPTQEGIYQHYKLLSESSPLPIILYNVPGRTGSNMEATTTLRLANDFKNIVAIKEASANFDQMNKILRDKPDDFLLISGDDPITLPMMAMGAVGVISVVGNILPNEVSELVRLCTNGEYEKARAIHEALLNITALCFVEGNPAGAKAALSTIGICEPYLRLPLVGISDKITEAIQVALKDFNKK